MGDPWAKNSGRRLLGLSGHAAEARVAGSGGTSLSRLDVNLVLEIIGELLDHFALAAVAHQDGAVDPGQLGQRRVLPDRKLVPDCAPARHHHHAESGSYRRHETHQAVRGEHEIAVEPSAM